jgi:thioredoxin 2
MTTGVEIACDHCAAVNSVDPARISAGARCGRCKAPLIAAKPLEVSDEQLDALVTGARLPVLVDFWAAWCPPCRAVAPHLAALAERQAGRLLVAKVDTDRHQRHMAALGIRSIPTLVVYQGGNPVAQKAGAQSSDQLERWVAPWLG